ncbi:MAG: porphobilinogen synthase [Candidatus Omnitrophota bacterium]|nr:porphobilinogen synthase [Candidatus Omnitrophota bacterium]
MNNRFRRLRAFKTLRKMTAETALTSHDLVQPFFVIEGKGKKQAIDAMPGIHRFSKDLLLKELDAYVKAGGKAGLFFGIPSQKDLKAASAVDPKGIVPQAVKAIKKHFPDFLVITDVCLCSYMSHGHCGIVQNGKIDNDKTLPILAQSALVHAQAGADIVAPSDMMDFRIAAIRNKLEKAGLVDTCILSYAAKYASAFYGPFRDAAHSAPEFGDRKTYQMDPTNSREALKEARQDIKEGADMVMVKPALAYLDIVSLLRRELTVPIVAYNVSGEYSMVKAAASAKGGSASGGKNSWVDEKALVLEILTGMKRAGADIIISYHAKDVLQKFL